MAELFTFDEVLERSSEAEVTESFCYSSLQCYLFILNYGIRAGGGIGEEMPVVSYQTDITFFIIK